MHLVAPIFRALTAQPGTGEVALLEAIAVNVNEVVFTPKLLELLDLLYGPHCGLHPRQGMLLEAAVVDPAEVLLSPVLPFVGSLEVESQVANWALPRVCVAVSSSLSSLPLLLAGVGGGLGCVVAASAVVLGQGFSCEPAAGVRGSVGLSLSSSAAVFVGVAGVGVAAPCGPLGVWRVRFSSAAACAGLASVLAAGMAVCALGVRELPVLPLPLP